MMKPIAPDVGALVEYGLDSSGKDPGRYRVNSWLRVRARPAKPHPADVGATVVWELAQEEGWYDTERFEWCTREEATHLSLSGICGTIAAIKRCKVTGMVDWPENHLTSARASARQRGELHLAVI